MKSPGVTSSTVTAGIWRLFALAVVVLVALLGLIFLNMQSTGDLASEIQRTEDIDRELRELEAELLDAETGVRGFLLTRADAYLAPYLRGSRNAPIHLQRLDTLMRHAGARTYRTRLDALTQEKLAELEAIVTLAQSGRHADALARMRQGESKRLMDELRTLLGATVALEQQLLVERRTRFATHLKNLFLNAVLGGAIAIVVLLAMAISTAARLKRPISNLLGGLDAMSQGQLEHRVEITTRDEIGRVANAFNEMAGKLQSARNAESAARAELQRSNAELDQFAYVASHDLKAPLRGIRNLTDWIADDLGPDVSEETRDNLRLLHSRVDRLDRLLESLLDYSRVGRREAAVEDVDTGQLVDDIAEYLALPAGFRVERNAEMPVLTTPRPPLETVLRNLVSNAIKHHDRDTGTIAVSTRDLGDAFDFTVLDDGPGIPPQFHDRVFQLFQTLKPRDHTEGSGMGLAIVKKTIEHYGGSIHIESAPPARGTAFVFTWPKGSAQPPTAQA